MSAALTERARQVLSRFPAHFDVERSGKQFSHVVEALGGTFGTLASQLAGVRNARRLAHAPTLRDLAQLGALHGVSLADLGLVSVRSERLQLLVDQVRATQQAGGDPLLQAVNQLLDALGVAGADERLTSFAPAAANGGAPDLRAAADALLAGTAPLVGFDALLEFTRRRLADICQLHTAGNGTVRALLLTALSTLDLEIDTARNTEVRAALVAQGRTSTLDLNMHDEVFHSADHFWHSTFVRPSAPLIVNVGVSLPDARVFMGATIALAVLGQRSGVASTVLLQRAASLGIVDPVPSTRIDFDTADAIAAAEGFTLQRVRRGTLPLTGTVSRRELAVRLGVTDVRLGVELQSLLGLATAADTLLTPQQAAVAARKWGYGVTLVAPHRLDVLGFEENPLQRERHPALSCAHGTLFTVRRRGFGRQTLRVQITGLEDRTMGPMLVNRDEGRGVGFFGQVPHGSALLVTEEGRVFLDGADNTTLAFSWRGACFAGDTPHLRDFVFDGMGVPATRRARFAEVVPVGGLDRESVFPHASESLQMPGINIGETRFAFFVQQAHLGHRGAPPSRDLSTTPRTTIGFANQSVFAGSSLPLSPAGEDPPAAEISLSWLEHEGYAVRVLIPSRFQYLDDEGTSLRTRVAQALERVRPAGIAVRVEFAADHWTLGRGALTDEPLNDNPNDLLRGGTTLWSPDDL